MRPLSAHSPAPERLDPNFVRWFADVGRGDLATVGGKNASLGELTSGLVQAGVRVPDGFALTAEAYRETIAAAGIEAHLREAILAYRSGGVDLAGTGRRIRRLIGDAPLPARVEASLLAAYHELGRRSGLADIEVAVRSSATAEDLPDASFAGQQQSFLNVVGDTALVEACRHCFASLFTDRAIAYREAKGFDHLAIGLSVGVQLMVRSDLAGSGVMFSLDPESGFPRVAVISATWGLGETVVQGLVDPDNYMVFKPLLGNPALSPIIEKQTGEKAHKLIYAPGRGRTVLRRTNKAERDAFVLSDEEILQLARWATAVEAHYGCPMDIEWAKDGRSGHLFLVQARPETVQGRRQGAKVRSWKLSATPPKPLLTGAAVGEAIATGKACVISGPADGTDFPEGGILVVAQTDPDWVPLMRRAAGIVTDHGGTTSHAAIISRELGIPAVVGTRNATAVLANGTEVTLSCAEGEQGKVYPGSIPFQSLELDLGTLPETKTQLLVNMADPRSAFRWWRLPAKGVGLARMEFIISNLIGIHPMALIHPERVADPVERSEIAQRTKAYTDPAEFFVDTLARGIARIACAYHPHPAIVRLSDFKSNEYAGLLGGRDFELAEQNPMIGFRGASRYYHERYRDGFALECRALKRVREEMGFTNVVVMVPFCRTPAEADRVLAEMARHGLRRGEAGLKVYVMAEIPANFVLAEDFADRFDGFSIGSNDLTQLMLGIDRDSEVLAPLFDERDPAVECSIADLIRRVHAKGKPVGICGQGPSDHADFAVFLVERGIDSLSLNPDSLPATLGQVAAAEKGLPRNPPWRPE